MCVAPPSAVAIGRTPAKAAKVLLHLGATGRTRGPAAISAAARPATAPRHSLPSGFGTQRESRKATAGRTKFGKADERTQPERYWPLTKNRDGAAAGFNESQRPMGAKHPVAKHSPVVKIKAPVRRDRGSHFHYYDDMPARFMGQTKVRKPQDYYDPVLKPPKIATTHQRTAFKSTYRYKKKRFQAPLEQLSWRI